MFEAVRLKSPAIRHPTLMIYLTLCASCSGRVEFGGLNESDDESPTIPFENDDDPGPRPERVAPERGFSVEVLSPQTQEAMPGSVVVSPRVRVVGPADAPLEGVEIFFTGSEGSSLVGRRILTDANGVGEAQGWRIAPSAGLNTVIAEVNGEEITFVAEGISELQIEVVFDPSIAESQRDAYRRAAARWEGVIVNDLPDIIAGREILERACRLTTDDSEILIDDIMIFASSITIDGEGGVLGQAGPCLGRSRAGSPLVGLMEFDREDLNRLEELGQLEAVILHEMGHVLGIGTLWEPLGLLENPSVPTNEPGADTHFTGPSAQAAFERIGGRTIESSAVPVENLARPGSSDGHWRESIFDAELMTPAISRSDQATPLSEVTVASLRDFGFYDTNFNAIDNFSLRASMGGTPAQAIVSAPMPLGCRLIRPRAYVE